MKHQTMKHQMINCQEINVLQTDIADPYSVVTGFSKIAC